MVTEVPTRATVREWHDEEGWGVLDAPELAGGCWAHFSDVAMTGYRSLVPGSVCWLEWQHTEQDGYDYRAVRVWPEGSEPVDAGASEGDNPAYSSSLTLGPITTAHQPVPKRIG